MKTKIAITGGIGSGKSTFLRYVREKGYPAFSCDEIYREVLTSAAYVEKITQEFPSCVIDGRIDRGRLAAIVFQDSIKRQALNQIAHPLIMQSLLQKMEQCEGEFVFAEVPLLFEGNYQKSFDKVIVLLREVRERIAAVVRRDGLLEREVKDRISSQFDYHSSDAIKIFKNCNAIILKNEGDEEGFRKKVIDVINSFENMKHNP